MFSGEISQISTRLSDTQLSLYSKDLSSILSIQRWKWRHCYLFQWTVKTRQAICNLCKWHALTNIQTWVWCELHNNSLPPNLWRMVLAVTDHHYCVWHFMHVDMLGRPPWVIGGSTYVCPINASASSVQWQTPQGRDSYRREASLCLCVRI